jgi:acetyltransferase-like isoleucine patch superfamily enzyme
MRRLLFLEWGWMGLGIVIYGGSLVLPALVFDHILSEWGLILAVFFVPVGYFLFLVQLVAITGLIQAFLPPVKEGRFPLRGSPEYTNWLLHYSAVNFVRLPGFMRLVLSNPLLRSLYHRLFGAKIHPSARISYESAILDPYLIEIGERTRIGASAKIAGHHSDEKSFVIARVKIGMGVLIGGDTTIGAGVIIGDWSMVEGKSGVLPFTRIPSGEVWGGRPARFRRKLSEHTNA